MLAYNLRLAYLSFRRNPALTALMMGAIAAGIAAAMITITLYHARSGNPIWWKDDRLYAVTLDLRSDEPSASSYQLHPEYPPLQVSYRDARYLYQSAIPQRAVRMFRSSFIVTPAKAGIKPFRRVARVTTADFFPMFEVPFKYGSAWARNADDGPDAVVVLSKDINEKLFDGANSVGKMVTLNGKDFHVLGVLDDWLPQPKFYDLNNSAFDTSEGLFVPFGWVETLQLRSSGSINCVGKGVKITSFGDMLTADCVWLQYWAEFANQDQRARFQQLADSYVTDEKKTGRFPRPLNNRIVNVSTWLEMNNVIGDDSRLQVALAVMFLVVCVLNTLGLMLAKFLGAAPITGLRRALGAKRKDIVRQHLTEVVLLASIGGALGLGLAKLGLVGVRALLYAPFVDLDVKQSAEIGRLLTHLDGTMIIGALGISLITGVLAGLYPSWRIGRLPPAAFLKTQ